MEYVADKGGFRAGVATNEPGTGSASGGGSTIVSTASDLPTQHAVLPQLEPLRVVDIQPFPAPLIRYEVTPNQPAPVPVQLLPPPHHVQQLPQQALLPQVPALPVVHAVPGVAQHIGLVQAPVFNQPPPEASQQELLNHGQIPLLAPPDFHVIEQSDAPNDGTQQNQILPNGNHVGHLPNFEPLNRGPPAHVHAPQPLPAQGPPALQGPAFFAPPQPTIQVAPPPAVQPPPISHAPPPAQVGPPPRVHLVQFQQNPQPPQRINIETARPQQQIEHVKRDIPRPDRIHRAPHAQVVVQSRKPLRMPTIHPTNDAQIFEVKTKVIDHGEVPFNNNPRQLTKNLPFDGPVIAAIKVADFSAPRDRVRNPEVIFKNLPPPSRRPPPSASRKPEPLIFLAVPPSAQAPKAPQQAKTPDLSKLFDAMPGPTVHDVGKYLWKDVPGQLFREPIFVSTFLSIVTGSFSETLLIFHLQRCTSSSTTSRSTIRTR